MKHYLYQLKLIGRLNSDTAWTPQDEAIVGEHFLHLKALTEKGVMVLVGRTNREYEDGFGIAVFKAENDQEAEAIMKSDPAIAKGIMTGTLFDYNIALESLSKKA